MTTHAHHDGNSNRALAGSQYFRQALTRLGHFARLLLAPPMLPAREPSDSLSNPDVGAARRRAARPPRPARPHSVERADGARSLSAYCECVNHTPAVHRCGLTAVGSIEQYGDQVRSCEYHARRAESFGLVVVYDVARCPAWLA